MSFNWFNYLSETGCEVAPSQLFKHVEKSSRATFLSGNTLELELSALPHLSLPVFKDKCWPCEVVHSTETSLFLKWCTPSRNKFQTNSSHCERKNSDEETLNSEYFWLLLTDFTWNKIHCIGWAEKNGHVWMPPFINKKLFHYFVNENSLVINGYWHKTEWGRSLSHHSIPSLFIERHALSVYQLIQLGGLLECQHIKNPTFVWPVIVLRNYGGRVIVTWLGSNIRSNEISGIYSYDEGLEYDEPPIFVLHHLHPRFHQLRWGLSRGYKYKPPFLSASVNSIIISEELLKNSLHAFPDVNVFSSSKSTNIPLAYFSEEPPVHSLKEGSKLEVFHQSRPYGAFPATVNKVLSDRYFVVEPDDLDGYTCETDKSDAVYSTQPTVFAKTRRSVPDPTSYVYHMGLPQIMPPNMSQYHGLQLFPPDGWPSDKLFTWGNYSNFLSEISQNKNTFKLNSIKSHCSIDSSNVLDSSHGVPNNHFIQIPSQQIICNDSVPKVFSEIKERMPESASDSCLYNYSDLSNQSNRLFRKDFLSISNDLSNKREQTNNENVEQHSKNDSDLLKDFFIGMKLEVVLPPHLWNSHPKVNKCIEFSESPICFATIIRVQAGLLWLLPDLPSNWCNVMDNSTNNILKRMPILVECNSTEIYPVGWSKNMGYTFIPPVNYNDVNNTLFSLHNRNGNSTNLFSEKHSHNIPAYPRKPPHKNSLKAGTLDISRMYIDSDYCPAIYINSGCYLGPYLRKSAIESLPRKFGPGPIVRVMQSLLTRLIHSAYKPIRVLRLFEADWATNLVTAVTTSSTSISTPLDTLLSNLNQNGNFLSGSDTIKRAMADVAEQRHAGMSLVLIRVRCPRKGIKAEAPVEVCNKPRALEEFCRQICLLLEACPFLMSTSRFYPSTKFEEKHEASESASPIPDSAICALNCTELYSCPILCHSLMRVRRIDRCQGSRRQMRQFTPELFENLKGSSLYNWNPERISDSFIDRALSNDSSSIYSQNIPPTSVRTRSIAALSTLETYSCNVLTPTLIQPINKDSNYDLGIDSNDLSAVDKSILNSARNLSPIYHFPGIKRRRRICLPAHTIKKYVANLRPVSARKQAMSRSASCIISSGLHGKKRKYQIFSSNTLKVNGEQNHSTSPIVNSDILRTEDIPRVTLETNPMLWTPSDVAAFLDQTDCRELWPWLAAEAVDGQAFMLLSLPVLYSVKGLRMDSALRLSRQALSVKRAFFEQFCQSSTEINLKSN